MNIVVEIGVGVVVVGQIAVPLPCCMQRQRRDNKFAVHLNRMSSLVSLG